LATTCNGRIPDCICPSSLPIDQGRRIDGQVSPRLTPWTIWRAVPKDGVGVPPPHPARLKQSQEPALWRNQVVPKALVLSGKSSFASLTKYATGQRPVDHTAFRDGLPNVPVGSYGYSLTATAPGTTAPVVTPRRFLLRLPSSFVSLRVRGVPPGGAHRRQSSVGHKIDPRCFFLLISAVRAFGTGLTCIFFFCPAGHFDMMGAPRLHRWLFFAMRCSPPEPISQQRGTTRSSHL